MTTRGKKECSKIPSMCWAGAFLVKCPTFWSVHNKYTKSILVFLECQILGFLQSQNCWFLSKYSTKLTKIGVPWKLWLFCMWSNQFWCQLFNKKWDYEVISWNHSCAHLIFGYFQKKCSCSSHTWNFGALFFSSGSQISYLYLQEKSRENMEGLSQNEKNRLVPFFMKTDILLIETTIVKWSFSAPRIRNRRPCFSHPFGLGLNCRGVRNAWRPARISKLKFLIFCKMASQVSRSNKSPRNIRWRRRRRKSKNSHCSSSKFLTTRMLLQINAVQNKSYDSYANPRKWNTVEHNFSRIKLRD